MAGEFNPGRWALAIVITLSAVGFGAPGDAIAQRVFVPRVAPVMPKIAPLPNITAPSLLNPNTGSVLVVPPAVRVTPVPNVQACCHCAYDNSCRSSCCARR